MIDLERYVQRVGYAGPIAPTRATLNGLMQAHIQAIPFENIDVLLGRPIDLSPDGLEQKLVREHRGGYCFEQNGLFLLVLEAFGFDVVPLSARVRYQRPRDYTPARTHLFLRVNIDGAAWAADVGVGALSLSSAIRLEYDGEQQTPHEPRRITREDGRYFHQVRFGDTWHDVLEFTGEYMPPIDRELANWYTSAHPRSHFRNHLMVARALPDGGRLTLSDYQLSVRNRSGAAESRAVDGPDALMQVLRNDFGLHLPAGTSLRWEGETV
jgi:N-hydroxyarylamine O-acetyltransferase